MLYLDSKGVSQYDFYKKSGVTRGVLQQNNGISEDNIARFLAYASDVNVEWLLTGRGEMLRDSAGTPPATTASSSSSADPSSATAALSSAAGAPSSAASGPPSPASDPAAEPPRVSLDPSVGTPYYDVDFIGGFSEIFNDQTTVPACNILVPGFEKATVWCNVTGHSMEPRISHGDIIALRQCLVSDIQYGEIYAVVLDTIRTIKVLRRGSTPDVLRFVPLNNDYDEQEFPLSRIISVFEVLGAVARFF